MVVDRGGSSAASSDAQHSAESSPKQHATTIADSGILMQDGESVSKRIIDIRRPHEEMDLIQELHDGLHAPAGAEKRIPTLLLYDELGLKLFEDITYLDDYYLTNAEIDLLKQHAADMAESIPDHSIVLELGSGNLRKVDILLRAIDALGKSVDYYALDLDRPELARTLAAVQQEPYRHVQCYGLWGTYDDGLIWLQSPEAKDKPRTVLSLGSSIGNFSRQAGADFLRGFVDVLGPEDLFLIGIDGCKDAARVHKAYNDSQGVTHQFVLNGLKHANDITGRQVFDVSKWKVIGEYNAEHHRHQAFISPTEDVTVEGVAIPAGEKLRIEESHKYDLAEITRLWEHAGVREEKGWSGERGDYAMHLISKQTLPFPLQPEQYASAPAPTWHEWTHLWSLWDTVTQQMIPKQELTEKPIKLRNACIFYLGHIPGFLDIKLTQTWPEQGPTEPAYYHDIFERGIDPDVDNPEHCHAHSEVPDTWPPLEEMLAYQERVRARIRALYDSGEWESSQKAARVLWLGYEHEAMHLETLLYMLVQSDKTLPPVGVPKPTFADAAQQDEARAVPNDWHTIPAQDINVGLNDSDKNDGVTRYFGWDIEKPTRTSHVPSFQAKARPITVGEYAEYLQETGTTAIPCSWTTVPRSSNGYPEGQATNGASTNETSAQLTKTLTEAFLADKAVRTLYGSVPLAHALTWPVAASYDELAGCAAWMGGRIPTFEEARSIYSYVDSQKALAAAADGRTIPAVNGHLVNDGVRETPPHDASSPAAGDAVAANGKPSKQAALHPHALFADLRGANVGFRQWYPASIVTSPHLRGQADMGGLWEHTSTPLRRHAGFAPMPLYPAYSADFFDDKHNIVCGGSWATVPRIAGRRSFLNWWQRNYGYVWAGARLVRDL
ncbi:hypothetical protein FH972_022409 [Carpinus fangiana]|uniref:Uncharacterized protein n=1 Tax=Carpinus fangiana TaxID=176857 RepID=A0A5N6KSQ6_9ROSI|nr:hypothetical protein FH972_022409 [Carpinus fangiana]